MRASSRRLLGDVSDVLSAPRRQQRRQPTTAKASTDNSLEMSESRCLLCRTSKLCRRWGPGGFRENFQHFGMVACGGQTARRLAHDFFSPCDIRSVADPSSLRLFADSRGPGHRRPLRGEHWRPSLASVRISAMSIMRFLSRRSAVSVGADHPASGCHRITESVGAGVVSAMAMAAHEIVQGTSAWWAPRVQRQRRSPLFTRGHDCRNLTA